MEGTYSSKLNLLLIRCRLHIGDYSMQLLIAPTLSAEDHGSRSVPGAPCSSQGQALDARFRAREEFPVRWISADASFEASPCPEEPPQAASRRGEAPQDEEPSLLPSWAHLMLSVCEFIEMRS